MPGRFTESERRSDVILVMFANQILLCLPSDIAVHSMRAANDEEAENEDHHNENVS